MTQVLVTGANGFVGSALCRELSERGTSVRGLVRRTSDLSLLEGVPVERAVGSLEDKRTLLAAMRGVKDVYHLAAAVTDWGSLEYFRRVNMEGTRNALDAAVQNEVERFVYVSSAAVHSFVGARDMDEHAPQLPTPFPYCQSKREAEALAKEYHRRGKLSVTIVRPGDTYGPGDRVSLLRVARLIETGRMPCIARGDRLGAFTYVENLAQGLVLAGTEEKASGETYIITDGIELTWAAYLEKLTRALGVPPPWISIHPLLAYGLASVLESAYRLLDVRQRPPLTRYPIARLSRDFHFTIEKARRELGYEPRVGIDEAIARTADWFRAAVRGGSRLDQPRKSR